MDKNVVEQVIVPEVPKVIPGEQLYVYIPIATLQDKGIASYDNKYFSVVNGHVSILDNVFVSYENFEKLLDDVKANSNDIKKLDNTLLTIDKSVKANSDAISTNANDIATQKRAIGAVNTAVSTVERNLQTLTFSTNSELVANITVTLDSNYVLTVSYTSKNGSLLGTSEVDFPVESMVVNGEYDPVEQTIILTLQNGNKVSFPIDELISGLVSSSEKGVPLGIATLDNEGKVPKDQISDAIIVSDLYMSVDDSSLVLAIFAEDGTQLASGSVTLPSGSGGGGSLDPSVLAEYVKKTDWANDDTGGVLRSVAAFGFTVDVYGRGQIVAATDSEIEAKTNEFKPIVPKSINKAIKVGITTNDEDWTDEEKAAACETVGAVRKVAIPNRLSVYAVDASGNDTLIGTSQNAANNGMIPLYNSNGNINVAIPTGGNHATPRGWVEENFLPLVNYTTGQPGKAYILNANGQAMMDISPNEAKAWTLVQRGANGVIYCGDPELDMQASNKGYVDALQKFTHYITIRSTDETASPANVNLQITNYDDFSLTVSESIYDFSQLASAIGTMLEASEENPGSVSASGSIIYNGSLHLVLSATTKDGTALILKAFDTSAQALAEITMEEPYFLIDEIIKKEI